MSERFHLDVIRTDDETIWFTLILEDPIRYFVEQHHESTRPFSACCTRYIDPSEFSRHWVNDRPLIKLVENKLQEIVEASQPHVFPAHSNGFAHAGLTSSRGL